MVMIKLKPLMESQSERPDPSLDRYLLDNAVESVSEYLYHGTPFDGLVDMLVHGIHGVEHGEVAEYDAFSTSINSNILHFFSEGDGETGLQFKAENIKVIVLDNIMSKLVSELGGSGISHEVDDAQFEEFCARFKVPVGSYKHAPYLPYGYLTSLGVDAFMYDYVWKHLQRMGGVGGSMMQDETEICFIGKGIPKLDSMISEIYVDGQDFQKKLPALRAIKKKMYDKS